MKEIKHFPKLAKQRLIKNPLYFYSPGMVYHMLTSTLKQGIYKSIIQIQNFPKYGIRKFQYKVGSIFKLHVKTYAVMF